MDMLGFVLVYMLCSANGHDCYFKPVSTRIYASEQECRDELYRQVGFYKFDELNCVEAKGRP